MSAVPDVIIVRAERLVEAGVDDLVRAVPRIERRVFSRTRSKMTIVSLVE